jgi:DNA-binding MarR family transcriptional regulator
MAKTIDQFNKLKIFSPKEMQVARKLAYNPGITRHELVDALGICSDDLSQYYNRFLKKARDFFHYDFTTTLDAALHLKHEGLI